MAEHEYDVQRAKEDKDQLMHHYEQQIKKLSEELSLEKRETNKMRQLMLSTTPQKKVASHPDVSMLREELEKKSELIKTLAAKVTTPKKSDSVTNSDLEKKHEAELCKVRKGYEKLIEDYKKTNEELLRHVPASAAKKVRIFSTLTPKTRRKWCITGLPKLDSMRNLSVRNDRKKADASEPNRNQNGTLMDPKWT